MGLNICVTHSFSYFLCHITIISQHNISFDFWLAVFEEIPMVAAQDLSNILKQGYLEKKRRGRNLRNHDHHKSHKVHKHF